VKGHFIIRFHENAKHMEFLVSSGCCFKMHKKMYDNGSCFHNLSFLKSLHLLSFQLTSQIVKECAKEIECAINESFLSFLIQKTALAVFLQTFPLPLDSLMKY